MSNLTQAKREKMLSFLNELRSQLKDESALRSLTEIETALSEKKYGLVWEKHSEKAYEMIEQNIPVLVEEVGRKITADENSPYNFLLEGDNLLSLKLLEKTHKGKIDIIYIDPPYNTGNKDFIYNDVFVDKTDGYSHSKWLSFMATRLEIARELLSNDGVIFISIDENEQAQLKLLCNEIFGEDNILSTHHIQVRYENKSLNERKAWQPLMEYVFIYAKNNSSFKANQPYENYNLSKFIYVINELSSGTIVELGGKKVEIFKENEWKIEKKVHGGKNFLKETWASGSVLKTTGKFFATHIAQRKEIDGLSCLYKVYGMGDDGLGYRYFTGPQKATSIRGKFYSGIPLCRLDELEKGESKKYKPITNLHNFCADFGNIRHEGGVSFNSGKKPLKLIKMLINYHTNKNATVLDFFAGSGTTGHAVAQLNKEDGGNRKYILCTNNENKICEEVTYQRLKNIQKDLPHNLKYFKTAFIKKQTDEEDSDESIATQLLAHIKELIELEKHSELDGQTLVIVDDEDELDEVLNDIQEGASLFLTSGLFLTRSQKRIIDEKKLHLIEIPTYYYRNELREVGEL